MLHCIKFEWQCATATLRELTNSTWLSIFERVKARQQEHCDILASR